MLAAIFPSIESSPDFERLVESYPDALKNLFGISGDFTTGPGYLDGELFSLMLPLFAIVLGVGSAARTLAGEEDAGRLELVLSYPVRRRDAVLAKGAAVAVELAILAAAGFGALALLDPLVGLDLSIARLAAAMAGVALLALFYGWLALAVAAATPSRALAIGVPAAVAAAGYLIGGLHELAGWLDPFRFLSPFWWLGQSPLRNGVDGWGALVVALAAVGCLAAAAVLLERRDLQTP
jgi:beta-exotoxin I transport system permease protein